ncbi:hypothetical protein JCGZ_20303 [Jatropha curcas]|uniref:Uncharacterized protein n=1 Tax=Jatropha curcas TaxID=180498 RepID=A0A067K5J3_JATCU|nr:hypothetical protein JCGZ_20303 [Jatropha curcas]
MARGRAFDLDASGNGSRGGRGPGRNARGRGGTIPPSSSGTSGASSSAQRPVLPPSLPSAPSSSTLVSGPVQSSPAAYFIRSTYQPQFGSGSRTKHFVWDEAITAILKVAWEKLCVDRYADFTYRMRKSDRNVSTSQQQPLPSHDPDAADDALVTPPNTTGHPAGTPPGDSTLDRADDQPRGFDFGPF